MSEDAKPAPTRPWDGISLPTLLVFCLMTGVSFTPGFKASEIIGAVILLAIAEDAGKKPSLTWAAHFLRIIIALLLIASAARLMSASASMPIF